MLMYWSRILFAIFETGIPSMTFPGGAVRLQPFLGKGISQSSDFETPP